MPSDPAQVRLAVSLGRLRLANPIAVASGTFGYAREMAGLVDLGRLGGILPKTVTGLAEEALLFARDPAHGRTAPVARCERGLAAERCQRR